MNRPIHATTPQERLVRSRDDGVNFLRSDVVEDNLDLHHPSMMTLAITDPRQSQPPHSAQRWKRLPQWTCDWCDETGVWSDEVCPAEMAVCPKPANPSRLTPTLNPG